MDLSEALIRTCFVTLGTSIRFFVLLRGTRSAAPESLLLFQWTMKHWVLETCSFSTTL